jgi:hypothetical protein
MANANVNKVVLGSSTLIDLTADTITAENVIEGYTFHAADGSTSEGSLTHLTNAEIDEITGGSGDSGSNVVVEELSVTANGTYTAPAGSAYSPVVVNVPTPTPNVQVAQSTTRVANTAYTKAVSLTCLTTGTYDVYWDCFRSTTNGTSGSQLHICSSAYGSANTTFSNHAQNNHLTGVHINANQEVAIYVRSRATNYYAYCGQLTIVQTA